MHYNKFPNLAVYHANFPNLKGPRAPSKKLKKISPDRGITEKLVDWDVKHPHNHVIQKDLPILYINWTSQVPILNIPREKSLAIYFGDTQFSRNRVFNFILPKKKS